MDQVETDPSHQAASQVNHTRYRPVFTPTQIAKHTNRKEHKSKRLAESVHSTTGVSKALKHKTERGVIYSCTTNKNE